MNIKDAYRAGYRTGRNTSRDWDDALIAFSRKYCQHSAYVGLCPVCRAWCDGFSDTEFHDTETEICDH